MKRAIFQQLKHWKEKKGRKPLLLRGARQVGKTFILQEFGKLFPAFHYLNFEKERRLSSIFEESLDPKAIIQKLSFLLNTSIAPSDLLIFDEIQECPRALTSLKYFSEEMPELALCSAGSLLGGHLGPVSFPVGKVDILSMSPLSFQEFLQALGEERALSYLGEKSIPEIVHAHLWERLKWYWITGGLPEVVNLFCSLKDHLFEAFSAVRALQNQLLIAYNADMAKHAGKVNAMHLDRLWRAIPEQLAKTQDGSVKRFMFKEVIPGINRYDRLIGAIDWLEQAGLIIKISITPSGQLPFVAHTKENHFKLFLFDVGLLGALSDLSPAVILEQQYGSYKGYYAENFVAQELFCEQHQRLFSWQEKTWEVEFLEQVEGEVIPIEVKSGSVAHAKSLHFFTKKYDLPFAVILSARPPHVTSHLKHYPLYQVGLRPWGRLMESKETRNSR